MLKKLLASALAVATVATCAYVPAALASAATTTKTATAADYAAYKLLNPDAAAASTKSTATLRVLLDGASSGNTYTTVAFENSDHNETYIAENLATLLAENDTVEGVAPANLNGEAYTASTLVKKEVVGSVYAIGSEYLVSVSTQIQVQISASDNSPSYVVSTKAEDLAAANVAELGWYSASVTSSTIVPAAYASDYNNQTKVASSVFANWEYSNGFVKAVYSPISEAEKANYATYTVYHIYSGTTTDVSDANLASGAWYADTALAGTAAGRELLVPKSDLANATTYIYNYIQNRSGQKTRKVNGKDYTASGVVLLTGDNAGKAVVTYAAPAAEAAASKYTTLTLAFVDNDADAPISVTSIVVEDTAQTITEDPEAIYAIAKAADKETYAQDTLADYLAAKGGENANFIIEKVASVAKTTTNVGDEVGTVTVTLNLLQADKTTVYYYDGVISQTTAYLTGAQKAATLTASDLGVAAKTTIGTQDAKFKSAAANAAGAYEVTYELGEATVDIDDFTTTTGLFNDKAYYNRTVKAGDDVRLNVALTDKGVAKGLDISKISVSYAVVGATQNGETYQKEETTNSVGVVLKAGQSTHFTLAAGTNIIVATVSYDGTVIGSFAPFYTYVG
jgi:hypothetical protein